MRVASCYCGYPSSSDPALFPVGCSVLLLAHAGCPSLLLVDAERLSLPLAHARRPSPLPASVPELPLLPVDDISPTPPQALARSPPTKRSSLVVLLPVFSAPPLAGAFLALPFF